jgi:ferrous iron transport protein B
LGAVATCHRPTTASPHRAPSAPLRIALVGAPNVGKSALFNRLTGGYVTVSNYPGTSVEVARGSGMFGTDPVELLDTPGLYSLLTWSEEERVARRVVLGGEADVLVQVADAKNLDRALPLTLQLAELGLPMVLAVNMMDEADRLGVQVDAARLRERLGIEVVLVSAVRNRGIERLRFATLQAAHGPRPVVPHYLNGVGEALATVRSRLSGVYPVDATAIASLLLQGDDEATALVRAAEGAAAERVLEGAAEAAAALDAPAVYRVAVERQNAAEAIVADAVRRNGRVAAPWADGLGRLLSEPLTGVPILLLFLYFGLFRFVGGFGAGTAVDFLEERVFEGLLNPFFENGFAVVPWAWLRDLFVGEYGVLTLGLRYAVAIILPIVGAFFLVFSIVEDSGYFPRLALLVDRVFKRLGLSGRAVIPMVLGFACDTMATMVTRTLETRRERVLATFLLALAVPCSAQLGVILGILSGAPMALAVWAGAVLGVFLLVGMLGARVLPGTAPAFHMEVPPLRLPRPGNVLIKTYTRMHWYFREVLPLFLLISVILWAGDRAGVFPVVESALRPVVALLGLPAETAQVFLFGFFRRDYGAAGLFDLVRDGVLSSAQITVAAVTLTLFVPCVAQFLMMIRERGWRTAAGMLAIITPFAFAVGALLNLILRGAGW